MEKRFLSAFLILILCGSLLPVAYAQGKRINADVTLDYVEPPEYAIVDGKADPRINTNAVKRKWLVIDVAFTAGSKISAKNTAHEWLDDVTVEAYMLVPCLYEKNVVPGLLTGSLKLWSLALDGDKHYVRFLVPPFVIARHFNYQEGGSKKGGNVVKLNRAGIKDIPVAVIFKTKDQRIFGEGYQIPKKSRQEDVAAEFKKATSALNVMKLQDQILPPEKTPWAWLNTNVYEMTKDQGSK